MSVVIRMKREGRKNLPFYRISVANPRDPRDGAVLEKLGFYDPLAKTPEKQLKFNAERARHWLLQGARASETVASIFRRHHVYDGLPGHQVGDRSGRVKKTATKKLRASRKDARVAAKVARPAHRRKPKKVEAKKPG